MARIKKLNQDFAPVNIGRFESIEDFEKEFFRFHDEISVGTKSDWRKQYAGVGMLAMIKDEKDRGATLLDEFLEFKRELKTVMRGDKIQIYDTTGFAWDADRVNIGHPECMFNEELSYDAKALALKIRLTISYARWVGEDLNVAKRQCMSYYARILNWIDNLEQSGCRCEIVIHINQCSNFGHRFLGEIVFKRAHEALSFRDFSEFFLSTYGGMLVMLLSYYHFNDKDVRSNTKSGDSTEDFLNCRADKQAPGEVLIPSLGYEKLGYHKETKKKVSGMESGEEILESLGYSINY